MKILLISLILAIGFFLVSGCSDKAKKQPASSSTSQNQKLSGNETPAVPDASTDHVSGNSSSSSNISGN